MDSRLSEPRGLPLAPKTLSGPAGRKLDNRVIINVGGIRFQTYKTTLKNIPDTRLSWLTETTAHNPDYDPSSGEYFFDRHPDVFNMILNYYRTGRLHTPTDVCGPLFEEELAFWGLDEKQIEPCCWSGYRAHRDAQETLAEFDSGELEDEDGDFDTAEKFGIREDRGPKLSAWQVWKPKIRNLLVDPKSSTAAQVLAVTSVVFVLLSIIIFCMESQVLFRCSKEPNATIDTSWSVRETAVRTEPVRLLYYLETVCIGFFTVELIVRFVFCPDKLDYVKKALNWVDFLSVLPFYTQLVVIAIDPGLYDSEALFYLNAVRLIRIFRILKLTRHVSGLKILGHTIKASAKELLLLILVLVIGVLIFACLIYYAEQVYEVESNSFKDIPHAFWWAIVTMTTLGYGDMYPRTGAGYLVGAVCSLCGVLMLALPVPVIVSNFTLYYSHAQARLKLPKKTKKILVGAADALKAQMAEAGSPDVNNTGSCGSLDIVERKISDDSAVGSCDSAARTETHELLALKTSKPYFKIAYTSKYYSCTLGTKPFRTYECCCAISQKQTVQPANSGGERAGISVVFVDEVTDPPSPKRGYSAAGVAEKRAVVTKRNSVHPQLAPNISKQPRKGSMNSAVGRRQSLRPQPLSRRQSLFPHLMANPDL